MGRRAFPVAALAALAALALASSCGDDDARSDTPSTTTSPPPPYVTACGTLCDEMIGRACADATCAPTCVSAHETAGACADAIAGYVACLAEHVAEIPDCYQPPDACADAFHAYLACAPSGPCGPSTCDAAAADACNCYALCKGTELRKTCTKAGDGFACTCLLDGVAVDECAETNLACHVTSGCCEPYVPK